MLVLLLLGRVLFEIIKVALRLGLLLLIAYLWYVAGDDWAPDIFFGSALLCLIAKPLLPKHAEPSAHESGLLGQTIEPWEPFSNTKGL